jgi:hypothetical protein
VDQLAERGRERDRSVGREAEDRQHALVGFGPILVGVPGERAQSSGVEREPQPPIGIADTRPRAGVSHLSEPLVARIRRRSCGRPSALSSHRRDDPTVPGETPTALATEASPAEVPEDQQDDQHDDHDSEDAHAR